MTEEDKPRDRSSLRYNSWTKFTNRRTRTRHNQIKEERRHLQLMLEVLELQVAKDTIAIQLSKKNERQVLGWII